MSHLRQYLLRRAAVTLLLALSGVTLLGQGIELLDRSGSIRQADLSPWTWVLQRLPLLFGLLVPVGTGLGAALFTGLLQRRGEWRALQGMGLSTRKLLVIPLPLVAMLVVAQALSLEVGRPLASAVLNRLQRRSEPQTELLWSPPGRGPVLILLSDPGPEGQWGHLSVLPMNLTGELQAYAEGEGLGVHAGHWKVRQLDVTPLQGPFPPLDALLPPPDELTLRLQGSVAGLPTRDLMSLLERLPAGDPLERSSRIALRHRGLELLFTPMCWWLCASMGLAGREHGRLDVLLFRVGLTLAVLGAIADRILNMTPP